jgi:hypothetical protein
VRLQQNIIVEVIVETRQHGGSIPPTSTYGKPYVSV